LRLTGNGNLQRQGQAARGALLSVKPTSVHPDVRLYPGLAWEDMAARDENRTDGRNKSSFTRLNRI